MNQKPAPAPVGGIESVCSCVLKKPPRRTLLAEGLTSCRDERRAEKALRALSGVSAEADRRSRTVTVLLRTPHSDEELAAALEAAGFRCSGFAGSDAPAGTRGA